MVVKFVAVIPEVPRVGRAIYPVTRGVGLTSVAYIATDTCGVSAYANDPGTEGCPHPSDHRRSLCRLEGEDDTVNTWIVDNTDKVTELSTAEANVLGQTFDPEFDINDWL